MIPNFRFTIWQQWQLGFLILVVVALVQLEDFVFVPASRSSFQTTNENQAENEGADEDAQDVSDEEGIGQHDVGMQLCFFPDQKITKQRDFIANEGNMDEPNAMPEEETATEHSGSNVTGRSHGFPNGRHQHEEVGDGQAEMQLVAKHWPAMQMIRK